MSGDGVRLGRCLRILSVISYLLPALVTLAGNGWAQVLESPQTQEARVNRSQSPDAQKEKQNLPAGQPQPAEQTPSDQSSQTAPKSSPDKKENSAQSVGEATKQAAQATLVQLRDWETQWLVGAYVSRNRPLVTLTGKRRRELYLQQTLLTPGAYLKRMFDATVDQERGVPAQWDDGWGGYAERWASREGQFIAANSLAALGDAKLGYEPRYDQCRCRGFWPRTRHVMVRNFLTYDRTEQGRRPQWALYGGAFGGGVISTAWKPQPRNAFAEGGRAMLGQAGWGILANFFTEFAVDINRKLGAKK
jgi:hypothetical protein